MGYESDHRLLTPAEVAELFRVSPKTVSRWAQDHRIGSVRTLGGHRRFHADEIRELLERFEAADGQDGTVPARDPDERVA